MIWKPKAGMIVKIHYRKSAQQSMWLHGCEGFVLDCAKGPGPVNALVEVNTFDQMTELHSIPRGNLIFLEWLSEV